MSRTRIYARWASMIARCERPTCSNYQSYGGQGIQVCQRWRESFEAWLADMGAPPEPDMEIDRIDSAGHYEPGNCRWATPAMNTRNRRVTPKFTLDGRTMALGDWADECGLPYQILKDRVRDGWTLREAMTHPIGVPRGKAS